MTTKEQRIQIQTILEHLSCGLTTQEDAIAEILDMIQDCEIALRREVE